MPANSADSASTRNHPTAGSRLIDDGLGHHFRAGQGADALQQALGMGATTLDDDRNAGTAERGNRCISREPAAAARPLGIPVLLVAQLLARDRVARVLREGGAVVCAIWQPV